MGVICRPIDCHEPLSPELAPQAWSRKAPALECRERSALTTPLPTPSRLALLPLDANALWRRQHLPASLESMQPRKRRITAARRGLKRRRIEAECTCTASASPSTQEQEPNAGSPRSLQFALPDLSSTDTLRVLHAMHAMPSELRHLNGSARRSHLSQVQHVFGWRHLLCREEQEEASSRRVVWKSAKALESLRMRALARQIWHRQSAKVLYTINEVTRVVRAAKRHCGRVRSQVWVERYMDDRLQVCVARKELRHFTQFHAPESSATECQGFLVRPVFARAINPRELGCSVQCLRAVDARSNGAAVLKQQLIQDLPRFTLQWEENYVYDLVAAPQVLLDSVFARDDN